MSDTHMVEHLRARCPDCGYDEERDISVHDRAASFVFECPQCGRRSRPRVDTAIARWQVADEDNYRDDMWLRAA
jgi:uncharacterized Zn finger protein